MQSERIQQQSRAVMNSRDLNRMSKKLLFRICTEELGLFMPDIEYTTVD
jgi:hypothetical protein